ncbi:MAG: outer membrane protein assembly factor BamE [Deltaproteobacteria bacterium]|nr:outer membrane protein assembly factor BamE [Deltaproteobacteria bacterium]
MKRFLLALPLVFLVGCSTAVTHTEGTRVEKDAVLRIEPGKTTRQMVIEAFGSPTEITSSGNEEKMTYVFTEKKVPAYLGGLVENEMKATEETTTLEVTLSEDIVRSFRFKSSRE